MNNETNNKRSWLWLALIAVSLLAGGIGGYFVFSFFSPGYATLNEITPDLMNRTRPIIREAKKVVVEQNDQTQNVANDLRANLLSIYAKPDKNATGWRKNNLDPSESLGEALPMTSDGWLITNFAPLAADQGKAAKNYVVAASDRGVFEIEKVIQDKFTGMIFIKAKGRSLSVKKLSSNSNQNGGILIGTNNQGIIKSFFQNDILIGTSSIVRSSDEFNEELQLNEQPNGFVALSGLDNDIAGFVSPTGKTYSARTISSDFDSFLKKGYFARPVYGFSYIDQSELIPLNATQSPKSNFQFYADSISVWPKFSPAQAAGIKSGDILVAINNNEFSGSLYEYLRSQPIGTTLKLTIRRGIKESDVNLKIGENK